MRDDWRSNNVRRDYDIVGWKKKGPKRPSAGESKQQKRRRLYVEKVCEIRKQISIAKAEVDRLKENRKLTKRGRRNREILHKECRTLSIASLVGYIEKKKSSLRKLKKGFVRGNKLEEARLINQQFKDDTSRVYAGMRRVLANDQESKRPKYVDPGKRDEEIEEKVFVNIEEVVAITRKGRQTSERIKFNRGLPQRDALCPRLFTVCLNPVAWKIRAAKGYRMSKPINSKVTGLLYIDDIKIFAASERGRVVELTRLPCLDDGERYKFFGVLESVRQENKLVLECAAREYLRRLSVIWTSPLSDSNRVVASNQFALPVLGYLMWTQQWPVMELKQIDREAREIVVESGDRHSCSSNALLYMPRSKGGRGLRSVEMEYKATKIKGAVRLHGNEDRALGMVREFEEQAARMGRRSIFKEAAKCAEELGLELDLEHAQGIKKEVRRELVFVKMKFYVQIS
ncbi:hypothetical protein AWC38_SpisGene14404 [Stylophora pistillata]|uniref:Reverse transcriptase domain-containing protein n=1 Tax=Stylophora pistillata TaxID=50429 RepID=A0A2B4RVD1_STYPI|nr:hypothetical protein AWC38_SpisGene14404 [Stylophora pistillata]